MTKLFVNKEKCKKCNICVNVCPQRIISINKETSLPFIEEEYEGRCSLCGHCIIYCKSEAINLTLAESEYEPDCQCQKIDLNLMPSQKQSETFIKSRRSTRKFLKKPVEHDKIMQMLNIAKYAPTGSNSQLVRWIIVENVDTTKKILSMYIEWLKVQIKENKAEEKLIRNLNLIDHGYDPIFRGAPQIAFAVVPKDYYWYEDAAIATTYFELAAHSLSVGTCWAGYVIKAMRQWKELREIVGIKDDEQISGSLLFGYPAMELSQILPPRKKLNVSFK